MNETNQDISIYSTSDLDSSMMTECMNDNLLVPDIIQDKLDEYRKT